GVRLDGSVAVGTEITPNFDSLLVKMTCRGRTFQVAVDRALRALKEFAVEGVSTNIGFLRALLSEPDFRYQRVNTGFIAD
ncbi:acetyl-CoA carboxylase biotin carboxylase subunit, partial [Klebsiella pneumoniae]|nr:acetyl-CoA carboxylase biotin carboxylase subunit [Klebsiella pneumoniae]